MTLYERAAELPIEVDSYELENLDKTFSSGFERPSTLISIHGAGWHESSSSRQERRTRAPPQSSVRGAMHHECIPVPP